MATKRTKDPLELGRELYIGGDYPGAVESFSRALATDPLRSEAYRLRGLARAAMRDARGSEGDFARAIETTTLAEATEAIHVDRGVSRFDRGDLDGAKRDLEHALRLDTKDTRAIDYLRRIGQAGGEPPPPADGPEGT